MRCPSGFLPESQHPTKLYAGFSYEGCLTPAPSTRINRLQDYTTTRGFDSRYLHQGGIDIYHQTSKLDGETVGTRCASDGGILASTGVRGSDAKLRRERVPSVTNTQQSTANTPEKAMSAGA